MDGKAHLLYQSSCFAVVMVKKKENIEQYLDNQKGPLRCCLHLVGTALKRGHRSEGQRTFLL